MASQNLNIEKVRKIKSLSHFKENELADFLGFMEVTVCPRKMVLFEEGTPGDSMYLIVEGEIRVYSEKPNGEVLNKNVLTDGDAFGDIAFFRNTKRAASVSAVTDSTLIKITAEAFKKLSAEKSNLASQFMLSLANSLTKTYKHFR